MDDTKREINLGAEICSRIKRLRYSDKPWADIYKLVASDFTHIKNRAEAFYPDQPILSVLGHIRTWDDNDIADAFE